MPKYDKKFLNSVTDFATKQQKDLSPYSNDYNKIKGAFYGRFQSQQNQLPITYIVGVYCNMKIAAQNSEVDINDRDYQNALNDFKENFTQNFGIKGNFLDETFDKIHDKELNNLAGSYNIQDCDLYEQYGTPEMQEVSQNTLALRDLDSRFVNANSINFYKTQYLQKKAADAEKLKNEIKEKTKPDNWARINIEDARNSYKEITQNTNEAIQEQYKVAYNKNADPEYLKSRQNIADKQLDEAKADELPKMKKLYASVRQSNSKHKWYDYILHPINTYRENKLQSDIEKRLGSLGVKKDDLDNAFADGIEGIKDDIRKEYSPENKNKEKVANKKIDNKDFNKNLGDLTKAPELDNTLQKSEVTKQLTITDPQKTFDIK